MLQGGLAVDPGGLLREDCLAMGEESAVLM